MQELIPRRLEPRLVQLAGQFPVVCLVGPRQSGKTTLARHVFPRKAYVSLEDLDEREHAREDPRGFLARFADGAVLDEVQRVPELFSYLQTLVDADRVPGRWVLTGSQNFLLMERVSQSLAGRAAPLHLLPLSMAELRAGGADAGRWQERLFQGFYPAVHGHGLDPADYYRAYVATYVERDVRELTRVGDLEAFSRFVRLCAGRSGQLVNHSGLAADAGVSQPTAKQWLSILQTSGLVALLRPHYENFSKRLIKTPKLYWLDSGLLCHLLRVTGPGELDTLPEKGALFESFVVAELFKAFAHRGLEPDVFFWRDSTGREVDAVAERGRRRLPLEVKASMTVQKGFFKHLDFWRELDTLDRSGGGALVYAGARRMTRRGHEVVPWFGVGDLLDEKLFDQ
jgi:hypothetical protein